MKRDRSTGDVVFWGVVTGLTLLLFLYLVVPFAALFPRLSAPDIMGVAGGSSSWRALGLSAFAATLATAVAGVLGIPFGYVLARKEFRGAGLLRAVVLLPLVMTPVVGGLLLLLVVGPGGVLGGWLDVLGVRITGSWMGVVLAQTFAAAPFVVITAESAFRGVDVRLEQAGATLGRAPWVVFRRISLPLARTGLLAGLVLAWMRALGEFGATAVLAYHPRTLPVATWVALSGEGFQSSLPLALMAVGAAAAALLLLQVVVRVSARRMVPGEGVEVKRGPAHRADDSLLKERGREDPAGRFCAPHWAGGVAEGGLLEVRVKHRMGSFSLDVDLQAEREVLVLFGPSGSGKTTLLHCVAGLNLPGEGVVAVDNQRLFAADGDTIHHVAPYRRRVATVFQDYALFPHLTVMENILFGAQNGERDREYALDMLAMTRLDGLEARYPGQLSGGQKQRVALARALMTRPRVLQLDEPFAALDSKVREKLQTDLLRLQSELGLTVIHVTHDLNEALVLADQIAVMNEGRVEQVGPKEEVLRRPATEAVARFMGMRNMLPGKVVAREGGSCLVRTECLLLWTSAGRYRPGDEVYVCARPEDVLLLNPSAHQEGRENAVGGVVCWEQDRGLSRRLAVRASPPGGEAGSAHGEEIVVDLPTGESAWWRGGRGDCSLPVVGATADLTLAPEDLQLVARPGEDGAEAEWDAFGAGKAGKSTDEWRMPWNEV